MKPTKNQERIQTNGSGSYAILRPYERAVNFASTMISAELADESSVRFALSELCQVPCFHLQRINNEGVARAEGITLACWLMGSSREPLLERCYRVLEEQSSNEPLGGAPKIALMRQRQKLRLPLMWAVGALGLALQCSDHFSNLIVTSAQLTEWLKKRKQERDGVDTPRM